MQKPVQMQSKGRSAPGAPVMALCSRESPPLKAPLTPFRIQQCRPLLQPGCSRKALKSVVLTPQQLQYFILGRMG